MTLTGGKLMSTSLKALRDALVQVVARGEAAVATYQSENRDPTDDELDQVEALGRERTELASKIEAAERRADLERSFAPAPNTITITGGHDRAEDDPMHGFAHVGEFFLAVHKASAPGGYQDPRLKIGAAPTSYGNTGTGSEGGYLIPPESSSRILALAFGDDSVLAMTDNVPVTGNAMSFPADETTPWGSTGVIAYWKAEASQATQTKPDLKRKDLRLNELFALVPMTTELLSDAAAAGAYVESRSARAIRWKTNDALINGTGAGQPLGILNAGSLVSQAKVTSQTADTINATNIGQMYGRCLVNSATTMWHVHPDAFHQLMLMTVGDQPVFSPPSERAPSGVLMGLPVKLDDSCQTLGDLGDIYLANWGEGYVTIDKGAIQSETSIHLWFDYGVDAFRAIFRVDGQPWLGSAISPANGSSTRSHFVTLAARA